MLKKGRSGVAAKILVPLCQMPELIPVFSAPSLRVRSIEHDREAYLTPCVSTHSIDASIQVYRFLSEFITIVIFLFT